MAATSRVGFLALNLVAATLALGCGGSEGAKKPASPSTIDHPAKETDLATVRLTPEAERRVGIEIGTVEYRAAQRTRTLGGEITVPPGQAITVTAPLAGTLLAPLAAHRGWCCAGPRSAWPRF